MKRTVQLILVLVGCIPCAVGFAINAWMNANQTVLPPTSGIGVALLVGTAAAAWVGCRLLGDRNTVLKCLNLAAFAALVLLVFRGLLIRSVVGGTLCFAAHIFYLPMMSLAVRLNMWMPSPFPVHVVSFGLLVLTSYLGCVLGQKLRKKEQPA